MATAIDPPYIVHTYSAVKIPDPSWTSLQGLGTSKVVNSSLVWLIIIPFVARVVDAVDAKFCLDVSLPFNALMLYCAAFAFTVAAGIFHVWCPSVIKLTPSYGVFATGRHSVSDLKKWFREIAGSKAGNGGADSEMILHFIREARAEGNATPADLLDYTDGKAGASLMNVYWTCPIPDFFVPSTFNFVRDSADVLFSWARRLAAAFYVLGFLALAAVAIFNVHSIWAHFTRHPHF